MLRSIIIFVAFLSLPCTAISQQIKMGQKHKQEEKQSEFEKKTKPWTYNDPNYHPQGQRLLEEEREHNKTLLGKKLTKKVNLRAPIVNRPQVEPGAQLNVLDEEQAGNVAAAVEDEGRRWEPGQVITSDRQYRSVMADFSLMSVDSPEYGQVKQSLDEYWEKRGLGTGHVAAVADVKRGRAYQLMAELGEGADLEPEQVNEVERTLGKGVVNFYKGLSQEEKDEVLVDGYVQSFVGGAPALSRVYLAERLGLDTDEAHVMAAELRRQAGMGRARREQVKKDFEEKINHTTTKQKHTSLIPLSFMNYQFIKDLVLLIGPIIYLPLYALLIYLFWKYMLGIYIILTSCLNLTKLCASIYIITLFILGTIIPAIHLTILLVALITLPLLIKHYDKKTVLLKQHLPLTSPLPLAPSPNATAPKIFKIIIATIILTVAYALPAEKDALSYYTLIIQSFILAFSSSLGIFYIIPFSFETLKKAKQSYILDIPSKTIAYALIAIASILLWYWTTDWLIHSVTGKDIKDLYTQPYHFKSRIVRYSYSNN